MNTTYEEYVYKQTKERIVHLVLRVCQDTAFQINKIGLQVLNKAQKMEQSIKRLHKRVSDTSSTEVESTTDSYKIAMQLLLDIQAFKEQLSSIGLIINLDVEGHAIVDIQDKSNEKNAIDQARFHIENSLNALIQEINNLFPQISKK